MEKKKIVVYSLLAITSVLALFFIFKTHGIKNQLEDAARTKASLEKEVNDFNQLLSIDSSLVAGNYGSAIRDYTALLEKNGEVDSIGIGLRIQLARRLAGARQQVNAQNEAAEEIDSLQAKVAGTAEEIRQYDAVSFELEKARVQLARMKGQLQERSFGEYLTFKSKKGNQMHYVGQVKNNQANGFGVALLDTGSRYEGDWKDNQRHGEGTFYWPDGEYYIGSYSDDKRNGLGTYYWPNGEKYTGQWQDDKRNGQGTFYGTDGEVVTRGLWKNDKLVEPEKLDKK